MRCIKCGSELKPGARFCSKCGAVNGPGGYPPSGPKKEKKPTALIVVLIILLVCLVLSIGGIAAYQMGVFDSFLPGSRTEETKGDRKDKGDRDKKRDGEGDEDDQDRRDDEDDEDDQDRRDDEDDRDRRDDEDDEDDRDRRDEDRDSRGESRGEGRETAPSSAVEETTAASSLPTMDPTGAVTEAPAMDQTTAAMPTLSGQGAGMGVPSQAPAQGGYPAGGSQDYILPDSSTRQLSYGDIAGLTKEQLRIARNEIYARHGRMFTSEELQSYFNSKSWYRGTVSASSFSENMLSQLEKDNIKLIQERENALQ